MHSFVYLPIKALKPYKKNSRKHSADQVRAIAQSISRFGFNAPVLIWGDDNEIVAGHARCQAATSLGIQEVPCVRLDHLTEVEKRAYLIADNKLQEQSEWDKALLLQELTELADLDFEIGVTGFDMDFLGTEIIKAADFSGSISGDSDDERNREDHEIIGSDDRKMNREAEGSIEYDAKEFDNLKHACPKCGFEFDKGMAVEKEVVNEGTVEAE